MKYQVKDSDVHGKGVFSTTSIRKDEIIGVPLSIKYGFIIDITRDLGKWINHSWTPNSSLVKVPGKNEWELRATRTIKTNEEISMDYRETPWFIAKPSIWYK